MRRCAYISVFLLCSFTIHAQNIEVGVAGGISTNSAPSANMYYGFDTRTLNYAGALNAVYNFADYLQFGIEGHVLELSGISNSIFVSPYNTYIGGDNKRFVYAKKDISLCGVFNGRYNVARGYVYAGAAFGYGIVRHNADVLSSNESYRAPNGGAGLVAGGQIGWVVGINGKLGAFIEAAYRYMDLKYSTLAPKEAQQEDLHYHVSAFPVIIGIRYRLINTIIYNNYQHKKGKSESIER
jgi:hypothetical protein